MPRTGVAEMFAVHTRDELKAVIDRIEANGRGKPIGDQMLAEATDILPIAKLTHSRRKPRTTVATQHGDNSLGFGDEIDDEWTAGGVL